MIDAKRCFKIMLAAMLSAAVLFAASPAHAAVTPAAGYTAQSLAAANPAPYNWVSSIAAWETTWDNYIIYAATDKKVYAYDTNTGVSTLVSDTSALSDPFSAVSGFLVTPDGSLYFHTNSFPTTRIGVIDLGAAWPAPYIMLETNCLGSIYSIARNPWDGSLWFASSDFVTHKMYLYRINDGFLGVTLKGTGFDAPHGGGNGPLVFTSPSRVLYGESVWDGNGYFHLVDTATGAVATADYITFTGGLSAAVPGKIGRVYAASGNGKTVYEIAGTTKTTVAATEYSVQGIYTDATGLYIAEQDVATGDSFFSFLTPVDDVRPKTLAPAANPAPFGWNASMGYFNDFIFYAGADKKIYAYNKTTAATALVCDTSALSDAWSAVSGFMAAKDGWLYFHANTFPTATIYRIKITNAWPTAFETLNTGCLGSIYAFCQNPWNDSVWFASSDSTTNNMYLYTVASDFSQVTQTVAFPAPHGGGPGVFLSGNGPIIFQDEDTLLYGESVWGGNGYLHAIDVATGSVIPDALTFIGGLGGASYGRNMEIYAASGDGLNVYKVTGNNIDSIAVTPFSAQGLIYDGYYHWVSVMDGTGAVSFYRIGLPPAAVAAVVKALESSGGCFVNTINGSSAGSGSTGLAVLGLWALASVLFWAFFGKNRQS